MCVLTEKRVCHCGMSSLCTCVTFHVSSILTIEKRVWDTLATGLRGFLGMALQLYPPCRLQQLMIAAGELWWGFGDTRLSRKKNCDASTMPAAGIGRRKAAPVPCFNPAMSTRGLECCKPIYQEDQRNNFLWQKVQG